MNVFLSEFKRLFIEKKVIYTYLFLISTFYILVIFMYFSIKISGTVVDGLNFWKNFLNSRLLTTFVPLFPILIYCGSFGDDVENKFINHIILKTGFKKYFINKYLVTVLSGGLLYFILSLTTFYISWLSFGIDPSDKNLKNSLSIKMFKNYLFSGDISANKLIMYSIVVSLMLLILGIIYTSIGFLISLYTNNKMLIYGVSILSLRLYESTIYTYAPILSGLFKLNSQQFYSKFSIFMYLGSYSDIKYISNSILMFFIISFIIIFKYYKLQNIYNKG